MRGAGRDHETASLSLSGGGPPAPAAIRPASPPPGGPGSPAGPVAAGTGIGLRSVHHDDFLAARPRIPWVEVHSENFFAAGGWPLQVLERVRRDYPVSLHGVGLSLGSADPLDATHLRQLQALIARVDPVRVSEHAAWSSIDGAFLNDLVPMPYTREALDHLVSRVQRLQEALRRPVLMENVSSYLRFPGAEMPEWEFMAALARRAGCGLLLDINNIYVNARNHGFDPREYLRAIPPALVGQMHLAGHAVTEIAGRMLLVDTHDAPVCPAVWELYAEAVARMPDVPALVEWDASLPPLPELVAEAERADAWRALVLEGDRAVPA